MKEENLEALWAYMDILITGLDVCHVLTDSTVWTTGETVDIYFELKLFNCLKIL